MSTSSSPNSLSASPTPEAAGGSAGASAGGSDGGSAGGSAARCASMPPLGTASASSAPGRGLLRRKSARDSGRRAAPLAAGGRSALENSNGAFLRSRDISADDGGVSRTCRRMRGAMPRRGRFGRESVRSARQRGKRQAASGKPESGKPESGKPESGNRKLGAEGEFSI